MNAPQTTFADRMARVEARTEENTFDDLLREYIVNDKRRFAFGGVTNLLASIASICEELSQLEGDNYEKAAQLIDRCADECDLKFSDAEDDEAEARGGNHDDEHKRADDRERVRDMRAEMARFVR